jgi:hypothetical protein
MGACAQSDLFTFAMTRRAFEDYCYSRSQLAAYFDERGRSLDASTHVNIRDLPYVLASGRGSVRSNRAVRDRDLANRTWSLFALSNGEDPLDDPQSAAVRAEGAQVRMISIIVPAGSDGGIFNRVSGTGEQVRRKCKNLADQVNETINSNYGHAFPAFVRKLVSRRKRAAIRMRRMSDNFIRSVKGDVDPWNRRLAQKFGYVLAAAVLLSSYGMAPWSKKQAWRAIKRIYCTARQSLPTPMPIDQFTDSFVEQIVRLVDEGGKFPFLGKNQELSAKQGKTCLGVVRKLNGIGRVVLIPLARLKDMCGRGRDIDVGVLLDELYRRRLLVKGNDGKNTRQVSVKGLGDGRSRYVCVRLVP